MAQLMSTSAASSASTRLRAEACDKGHVPAQLPLPEVVTLMCNLMHAVWFWQHSSVQGPPPCAKHRNFYRAHFCLQGFRNNNVSFKKWRVLRWLVPFPFLFSLSAQQTHLGSIKICLSCSHGYRSHLSYSVRLQLGTQDQTAKWHFERKRTLHFYLDF